MASGQAQNRIRCILTLHCCRNLENYSSRGPAYGFILNGFVRTELQVSAGEPVWSYSLLLKVDLVISWDLLDSFVYYTFAAIWTLTHWLLTCGDYWIMFLFGILLFVILR